MFRVVLLSMLLFMVQRVSGQDLPGLQGRVHYEQQPLANATVVLRNTAYKSITDSTGFFSFPDLKPGRYSIFISMIGFEHYHQWIDVAADATETLSVSMQPVQGSLDEVVVTGTLKAVQKLHSPIAVEVYNPQFFRKNPAPSIFESLQMVNGVRPQINCSVCNTGDVHINGLEGPYTMVTIDGMPIVSSLSSVYGLFGIPNQMIEKVEIIKGPASGLYGSEAIGGLINIITKEPAKAPRLSVQLMSTSWLEHNADLGFKWKAGKNNALLGINYFHYSHPQDHNHDGFTDVTLQQRISVFNKWQFQRKQDRVATVAARYFYEDRWGGEMGWTKEYRGSDRIYGESIYTNRMELIGNYQLPVKPKMLFSFSGTRHRQNSYYGTTPFFGEQKILFGQLTLHQPVRYNHDLLVGLAGRNNYYDDNSTATEDTLLHRNQPEQYFLPGIFVQDEWNLGSSHVILLGLRIDHHPVHRKIITPRVAYKWSIDERQTFRLNAGTGFRVVNLFTEDHAALTGARAVVIREKLKPEESYNINLNYSWQSGNTRNRWVVDASAWYTYFHNQIIADYETNPNQIIYNNLQGHAISKGLTVNAEWNLKQRWKGNAGITLQDVAKLEDIDGKKIKSRPMFTEKFSGTWAISYSFPLQGITIDYTGNVYGPMRLPLLSSLDPRRSVAPVWSIQNIQVTKWISQSFEVFGGVKNLLNWTPAKNNAFLIARAHDPFDKNVVFGTDGKVQPTAENPYALTFDPSYIYAPNQGIRAFVGFRWKLK